MRLHEDEVRLFTVNNIPFSDRAMIDYPSDFVSPTSMLLSPGTCVA